MSKETIDARSNGITTPDTSQLVFSSLEDIILLPLPQLQLLEAVNQTKNYRKDPITELELFNSCFDNDLMSSDNLTALLKR